MAGLKKPVKKRDDSKPGTVLVIFLVFFILLSIGLGVWGYYGYAGQDQLRTSAKNDAAKAQAAGLAESFWKATANELRVATGHPLDANDVPTFAGDRKDLLEEGGKYAQGFAAREAIKKMIEDNGKTLGGFVDADKRYAKNFRDENARLNNDLKKTQELLTSALGERDAAEKKFLLLSTKQDNHWKTALANIKKDGEAAVAANAARTAEMQKQFELNQQLEEKIKELNDKSEENDRKFNLTIKRLQKELAKFEEQRGDVAAGAVAPRSGSDGIHALLLDISQGKPLWDNPLGRISRVDLLERQVYISLGAAHGVKPELTFNVFGVGPNGRADKNLKGTIEVIRVIDANTSLARITSIYDKEGNEIAFGDATLGRISREAENPMKEGDLLFNMFWGARIAIGGYVPFGGAVSKSPAEQMRQQANLMFFLQRQGMIVDAYLDLIDGKVKGDGMTSRTRYLIRGLEQKLEKLTADTEPKKQKEDADKEEVKRKEEQPKNGAAMSPEERLKMLDAAFAAMRKEAVDKGVFIISAENFFSVIGYRPPRSSQSAEVSGYRPTPLFAGPGIQPAAVEQKKGNDLEKMP
ncbi:MAG: hypothetical protein L0215_19205 [Gemmataceae bacterium]|nr:hypothetical protein [Gemmataceae bacterium]